MDTLTCEHKELADGGWEKLPFELQMGNIGSEVSRSLKWFGKNEKRFQVSMSRALELFDLTIEAACHDTPDSEKLPSRSAKLKEVCRAREEFCDYFLGNNSWGTDPQKMQRYYDQFALMGRRL